MIPLDGGHIFRALFGKHAVYVGYATVLTIMGMFLFFGFGGFLIIILFIAILGGVRHPPPLNDHGILDARRKVIGAFAAVILIISFHPVPLSYVPPPTEFALDSPTNSTIALPGDNVTFLLYVNNSGMEDGTVDILLTIPEGHPEMGWNASMSYFSPSDNKTLTINVNDDSFFRIRVMTGESITLNVTMSVPANASTGAMSTIIVTAVWPSKEYSEFAIDGIVADRTATYSWDVMVL